MNSDFSDIATALTGSVAADGQTPMTGPLIGTTAAFSGTITAADGSTGDQVVNNSQFERTLAIPGKQYFPGGLFMQWGANVTDASGNYTLTFPRAFPTGVVCVQATPIWTGGNGPIIYMNGVTTTTTAHFKTLDYDGVQRATDFYWFAIGY